MTGATVNHDIEALCKAIKSGATLAEACRSEGVPYNTARRWLERGATSKPATVARVNRDLILKAQAQYLKGALAIVHKAAARGAPRAVDEVLRRVEAMSAEASYEVPPSNPLERARWRLQHVELWIEEDSGIARTRLLEEERNLLREIERLSPTKQASHTDDLEALRAELADWPDAALLLVVEYARSKGL